MAASSSRVNTEPVGLCGLLSRMSRVRGVMAWASSSRSGRKPGGRSVTGTLDAAGHGDVRGVGVVVGLERDHLVARLDQGQQGGGDGLGGPGGDQDLGVRVVVQAVEALLVLGDRRGGARGRRGRAGTGCRGRGGWRRRRPGRSRAGPSRSGKPWPRLIDPVATARADISAKIVVPRPARRRLSKVGPLCSPCAMMPCWREWPVRVGACESRWARSRSVPYPAVNAERVREALTGGRGAGGGPGRVPRGDAGQVRLGPAGGGRAAGRAVLLGAGGRGEGDRGGAGGRGVRARAGRPGVQHRGGVRRGRGAGRLLPEAAPVRRVRAPRVGPRRAGVRCRSLCTLAGVRTGLEICYDVRFGELSRALAVGGASLLVLPAAWAAGPFKEEHWVTLVRARAIENTVWVAAVGQVPDPGEPPTRAATGVGRSMLVDPLGVVRLDLGPAAGVAVGEVDVGAGRDGAGHGAEPGQPAGRRVRGSRSRFQRTGDCQRTGCSPPGVAVKPTPDRVRPETVRPVMAWMPRPARPWPPGVTAFQDDPLAEVHTTTSCWPAVLPNVPVARNVPPRPRPRPRPRSR